MKEIRPQLGRCFRYRLSKGSVWATMGVKLELWLFSQAPIKAQKHKRQVGRLQGLGGGIVFSLPQYFPFPSPGSPPGLSPFPTSFSPSHPLANLPCSIPFLQLFHLPYPTAPQGKGSQAVWWFVVGQGAWWPGPVVQQLALDWGVLWLWLPG